MQNIGLLLDEGAQRSATGDWNLAERAYRGVLELAPGNVDALFFLGLIGANKGEYAAARHWLEQALAQRPNHLEALNALGNVNRFQQEWRKATDYYLRALDVDPHYVPAISNLGLCLKAEGKLEESLEHLERAYRLRPDDAGIVLNYALGLREVGRDTECEAQLRHAIRLEPELVDAHTNLATHLLKLGSFREGWREYEWRLRASEFEPQVNVDCPVWDGTPLDAAVLLVRGEQGLGDQIMFASYLPEIMRRTKLCLIEVDQRLKQLFARSFPGARIYAKRRKGMPGWASEGIVPDWQIQVGSLPERLGRDSENIPKAHGYLLPDTDRVQAWRSRLDTLGAGPKIGVAWRGGTPQTRQAARSVPLEQWAPLLAKRAQWISLQHTDCRDEIREVERIYAVRIHQWQDAIEDYDQTAALVYALDLVISVQTAVVHLSGALGKPVWVMVPAVAEWRYMQSGERMPWYPSARLWRQPQVGDWSSVIAAIAKAF